MKQRVLIFLGFISLLVLLIGLNAASFARKETIPDNEYKPNRSTYNGGATGTRAFYDLLNETGRKAIRWQAPMSALFSNSKNKPQTFVIVGQTRREITDKEIEQILRWVSEGGKLVIIDREPPAGLIKTTANWSVSVVPEIEPSLFGIDPSDQKQMTENIVAARPAQPTVFTKNVNAVQPSRFASSVKFEYLSGADDAMRSGEIFSESPKSIENGEDYYGEDEPPLSSAKSGQSPGIEGGKPAPSEIETVALNAPVVHLANNRKNILVDFPFGSGEIAFLTEPYIVSNGGINFVDNAQLAINLVVSRDGTIAFDEFHQGFGASENQLVNYFAGTPVIPIFMQLAAIAAFVLFSQSKRFARPLPSDEPNRLSKLEYVAAMAELQRRTGVFDLAIENIYTEFRRRAARVLGVDSFTVSRKELARMIAGRAKLNIDETENLMFKCEEIIHGEQTNKREVLKLASRIRETEEKLGIKRTGAARK